MALLLKSLLGLSLLVALALQVQRDPGYAIFGMGHWTIEMSFTAFFILLLLLLFVSYSSVRGVKWLWRLPKRLRHWWRHRQMRVTADALNEGLVAQVEGRWADAERALAHAAAASQTPVFNYLAAARAAQEQDAPERRDEYLRLAAQHAPADSLTVAIAQAELQLDSGEREAALTTLLRVRAKVPKHVYAHKLLVRTYRELGDWETLLALGTDLRRYKVMDTQEAIQLERDCYRALVDKAGDTGDADALDRMWQRVPDTLRHDPGVLSAYVRQLLALGETKSAEPMLRDALKRRWNEHLVYLYGLVEGADAHEQLVTAERWLKDKPHDAIVLLTVGRLCLRRKIWGKARTALETSIANGAPPEAYHALAKLLEQLKEPELALSYYRKGLAVANERNTLREVQTLEKPTT
ncbi:MAG: heme biosynthesis protein HemY [Gammaproteobacteria bacterium]|nr:heme biosynthesis protein HemY [Gammaproteobacteria bacterium]